jgi:hypothetical protein
MKPDAKLGEIETPAGQGDDALTDATPMPARRVRAKLAMSESPPFCGTARADGGSVKPTG